MKKKVLLIPPLIILIAGCTSQGSDAVNQCIQLCNEAKNTMNMSNGPCLANPIDNYSDWVCDVAHSPRQDVDNQPENQCSAFGVTANHFVELDENCNFIREV